MILKIGYFADRTWSYETFNKLINDYEIIISFICVRYDSKDKTLKNYAKQYGIDYLKHENINANEFISIIEKYNCDLFVSMSFNQIFKTRIINLPKYKTINCHVGKLPFYRGRNILNWVLINDEKEFDITVHYVDEGIGTSDIILQRSYPISEKDNYKTLLERAYLDCAVILYDAILMFKEDHAKSHKQIDIHPVGFYCTQRKIGDEIFNFVRALCSPGPIARAFIGEKEMKINKVEYIKDVPIYKCIIGAIINKDGDNILVKTQDSFVKVTEYEYDEKIKVGDRFAIK